MTGKQILNEYMETLHETTLDLLEKRDVDELLGAILARVAKNLKTDTVFLYLLDEDEDQLVLKVGQGHFKTRIGYRLDRGAGIAGKILQTGKSLIVEDYASWKDRVPDPYWDALRSIAGFPIKIKNKTIGVIGVHQIDENKSFLPHELQLLKRFSDLASLGLRNAHLYERLQSELTKRRQVEIRLRESKERYQKLFENAQDAIFIEDKHDNIIDVNIKACQLLGYTRDELLSMTISDIQAPEARGLKGKTIQNELKVYDGKFFETIDLHKDGTRIPVEISTIPLVGKELVLSNVRDIRLRKKATARLHESEEKFRSISTSLNDALITINHNGKITYWNQTATEIFGYSAEEVAGRDLHRLVVPEKYIKTFQKGFKQFVTNGTGAAIGKTLEMSALRKNGDEFPVELSLSSYLVNGQWHAVGTIRDISDRKKAEKERDNLIKELKVSLEKIKTLERIIPICSHCKKIRDDKGYWNQIESYIHDHSETTFSHGICQECAEKLYPDMDLYDDHDN